MRVAARCDLFVRIAATADRVPAMQLDIFERGRETMLRNDALDAPLRDLLPSLHQACIKTR